jgi:sporulation protein YlmC with PRC-barrel domain
LEDERTRVLLATEAMDPPDWSSGNFPLQLDKEQVRRAPGLDANIADITSPMRLEALHAHFSWSNFWPAGPAVNPSVYEQELVDAGVGIAREGGSGRSRAAYTLTEISGFGIVANDGEIGSVKDLIMDDEDWRVRYLVVDTGKWLLGKKVLLSADWIQGCDRADSRILVDVDRDAIRDCPEFDPSSPASLTVAERLYDFYGRPKFRHRQKTKTAALD